IPVPAASATRLRRIRPGVAPRSRREARSGIGRRIRGQTFRPGVEVIDMIAHVAAVTTKPGPGTLGTHRLQLARAEAQVEGGLLGRQERTSLPGPCGPGNFVFHKTLA